MSKSWHMFYHILQYILMMPLYINSIFLNNYIRTKAYGLPEPIDFISSSERNVEIILPNEITINNEYIQSWNQLSQNVSKKKIYKSNKYNSSKTFSLSLYTFTNLLLVIFIVIFFQFLSII
ncbi:hypothetical protein C2G38_2122356 [Gigaspora rosea]|uniref:Uncharacterized protein n=1 Tax=Gigaspora rosea TaxID=44941 RepID=A0A397U0C9_9GLOM|nr:hypothetical protein C2G38_2122356 [Gigaspora rosea]